MDKERKEDLEQCGGGWDVKDDLRRMGIGDWRRRLEDQGIWSQLVGEAKAHL